MDTQPRWRILRRAAGRCYVAKADSTRFASELQIGLREFIGHGSVFDAEQSFEINRIHRSLSLVVIVDCGDDLLRLPSAWFFFDLLCMPLSDSAIGSSSCGL